MQGIISINYEAKPSLKLEMCTKQILWNPHWTTEIGLTGEEEHEQVFSKLYLYAYVLIAKAYGQR